MSSVALQSLVAVAVAATAALETVASKDGTSIAFERTGEGPVVILVAGALSDRSMNAPLATRLAGRFTVINYDRRGRGASGDTQPYAVEREVEDLEALIEKAGGTACLYGISSGAVLALEASTRLPAKVRKLVLYEPPFVVDASRPRVPQDFVKRVTAMVAEGRRGDAVEYFMVDAVGFPAAQMPQMNKAPMWPGLEKVAHTLAYDVLVMGDTQAGKPLPEKRWAAAKAPTLVISGGRSEAWLRNAADALDDVLPRAERQTLEGQDHGVQAAAIAPVLEEFFAAD